MYSFWLSFKVWNPVLLVSTSFVSTLVCWGITSIIGSIKVGLEENMILWIFLTIIAENIDWANDETKKKRANGRIEMSTSNIEFDDIYFQSVIKIVVEMRVKVKVNTKYAH